MTFYLVLYIVTLKNYIKKSKFPPIYIYGIQHLDFRKCYFRLIFSIKFGVSNEALNRFDNELVRFGFVLNFNECGLFVYPPDKLLGDVFRIRMRLGLLSSDATQLDSSY